MNIERAAPGTIWCVRYTPNVTVVDVNVLKSTDGGHTWSLGAQLTDTNTSKNWNSLLNPFPDAGDPSYAVAGEDAAATGQVLEKSTDGWASKTTMTAPTGYTGISSLWRVNKRTFDDLHIMAWWYHTAEAQYHLLETNDGGATWELLWDSAMGQGNVSNLPMDTAQAANHNTPNGWSPDPDQWVLILANANGAPVTNLVRLTLDNFATLHDRTGNLITLGGAWPDGANDGFALPKVGENADEPTPEALMPRWGEWDDDAGVFTLGALSNSASASADVAVSGVSATVDESIFLQLGPPANTRRMVVEGTWSQTVTRTGTPSTNVQNGIGKPISVSWTEDFTPDIHSNTAGTWSGSFTAEYEFAGGDWPNNKDILVSSPPTSGSGSIVYFWCDVSASSANAAYAATCMSSFTVTVTEIELDDGTIYTP
jgi:hypothetical protein